VTDGTEQLQAISLLCMPRFSFCVWPFDLFPPFQISDGELTVDDKSAIVTINAQGIIQLANKVACAMLG
jgi:hypothetical protein